MEELLRFVENGRGAQGRCGRETSVEQERGQAIEVARVEGSAERFEHGGRRGARRLGGRLDELAAPAVERRLHRPRRRRESFRDLLERQIEDVLEDHGGALLRSELPEQGPRCLARGARIARDAWLVARRRPRLEWFFATPAPQLIEPQIGGHAEQPGSRVRGRLTHLPERDERARHRVLREVLGVPWAAGEVPAVAIEVGPERLVGVEEPVPGGAQVGGERDLACRRGGIHGR
jgi:hypothetical protein